MSRAPDRQAAAKARMAKIEAAMAALQRENRKAANLLAGADEDPAPAPAPALEPSPDPAPRADALRHLRQLEAILFAAAEPLDLETLRRRMPSGADVGALLIRLEADYQDRGVRLVRVAGAYRFETAPDLKGLLVEERREPRKLSQAALETLAIIAYHQPVTRAEIEEVRGVAVAKGTLDVLLELGWVRPRGRRRSPGRPMTYATTDAFLAHFGLDEVGDLPGKEELKAAGLLDSRLPPDFEVPDPSAGLAAEAALAETEPPEDAAERAFHTDFLAEDGEGG